MTDYKAFSGLIRTQSTRRALGGFSLLELMIATAVVAILAAVAIPNYTNYINRARRAEARTMMLDAAQFMQRYYAANNTYVGAALPAALTRTPASGTQAYTIQIDPGTGGLTATTYRLQAVPTGPMAGDKCGTITITSAGVQGRTGTGETLDRCWK